MSLGLGVEVLVLRLRVDLRSALSCAAASGAWFGPCRLGLARARDRCAPPVALRWALRRSCLRAGLR